MYHSKKIAVFISHIFGNFQHNLCQGIIDKASEFGYTVEIFSSTDGEDVGNYGIGETSILRIPNYDEFSGICFASGTYLSPSLKQSIAETLSKLNCPILEITQKDAVFPYVRLDNNTAAGQLTEHMIATHRHTRVCYLGNSLERQFSDERFRFYKDVMEKYGLPVSDADYYCCDYSYKSIEAALSHFLMPEKKPDSIICYNDRMAMFLMEALYNQGFHIPGDIAVAGFDNLEIGQNVSPALSTVTFPIYEMGEKAMSLLLDAINHIPLPSCTTVMAQPLYHGSCGCSKKKFLPSLYENRLMDRINTLENAMLNDIKMSSALQNVRELDDGMELLEKFLPRIESCSELYICLYQNWDSVSAHIQEITSSQETDGEMDILIMPFAYKDGKRLHNCSFTKKSILPDYIYADYQTSYIYCPLYFGEKEFGYAAFSCRDNRLSFRFDFLTWIVNVSRMLKNICESKQTDLLVNRLEDIYMKDDLTGLYNRQGFRILSTPLLEQARAEHTLLLTMVFDLDGLKTINDTFGHLEGDFAIQVLGHALEHSCGENILLARLGGDEFYALSSGLSEEDAREIIRGVNKYLENYNQLHTKKYYIRVSSGYAFLAIDSFSDIQKLFDVADKKMYEKKKAKDKVILKN